MNNEIFQARRGPELLNGKSVTSSPPSYNTAFEVQQKFFITQLSVGVILRRRAIEQQTTFLAFLHNVKQ